MPRIVPVPMYPPPMPLSMFPVNQIVSPTYPNLNGTKIGGSCSSASSSQSSRSSSSPAEAFVEHNDNQITNEMQVENLNTKNDRVPGSDSGSNNGKEDDCIVIGIGDSSNKSKENDSTSLSSLSTTSEGGSGSRSSPGIPASVSSEQTELPGNQSHVHRKQPDERVSPTTSISESDSGRDQNKRTLPTEDTKESAAGGGDIVPDNNSLGGGRLGEGENVSSFKRQQPLVYGSHSDSSSCTSEGAGSRPRPVSASAHHVQQHSFQASSKRPPFNQQPYHRRPHSPGVK